MIHKLLKRPQAIIGLCLIAIVIVIAIAAPAFSPHDPELVNLSQKYAQPDAEYLKAIFILEAQHGSVRSVEVAEYMNVSKASVNYAVRHTRNQAYYFE